VKPSASTDSHGRAKVGNAPARDDIAVLMPQRLAAAN
jgi:hypothetical protein